MPTEDSSTSSQLTNALTNLCTSYPTFLSLHSTTTNLTATLSSFSGTLTTLLDDIPALESAARSFSSDISSIQSSRRRAALVLEHSSKLQDILELPVLADARAFSASTGRTKDVHAEADSSIRALFAQLLATLRAQGKLPTLFRAVSFLRRMRVLPERALALAFLTGRLEALNTALTNAEGERRGLDAPDAWARYMKKYIDTWREGVHDLVTQYAAIFLERPPADLSREDLDVLRTLLPACASQLLSRLLDALRTALPRLSDAPTLTALLTQLTYCSTSFARLGLDFRTLLPPLFEDAVLVRVSGEFSKAAVEFGKTPRTNWAGVGAPRRDSRAAAGTTAGVLQIPPQALVAYPPVAVFANALLAALNGLRLLAPVALLKDLVRALDGALAQACRVLLDAPREEAHEAATAFVRLLVPFVRRGLIEGFHQSNVKVHPRIKREHAEPNVTTATVTYPIACRLDYSRITSVSASVPLQTLCHPLRAASPIIYTRLRSAATPSAFAPVSLKPPNPVTPAPRDAPPFDIAGEERLLQDIVDKALELVEARLSSRLAITTALLREECKRAAGVIKFGIMNVLARRE
ncbi:Dor1-like family-domain-containing protein [Lactarius hengduanensis]|nr:Dor1-like family-domain-containing protein [Lactarius hengduanensis]